MKKIYLNELEEKSIELANYSKNDINLELEELKKIPNDFVWVGPSKDKFVTGYNKKVERLVLLNNNICKIAEFLLKVKEDYNSTNEKINNAYEELLNEIKLPKEE